MATPKTARSGAGALLLLAAFSALPQAAQAEPPLVVLVRHADRGAESAEDPGLSPAGEARAKALGHALGFAHIGAVITTQYRRTHETGLGGFKVEARHL
jgi:hypothetical protein